MPNATGTERPTKEFWRFAVALYAHAEVRTCLLAWQEIHGANVNLALLCIWAGNQGRRLTAADLRRAEGTVCGWNAAVTKPLRILRQRLKADWRTLAPDAEPSRQAILAAELEAEKAEQALLLRALAPWRPAAPGNREALIAANLAAYLGEAATAEPAASIAAICASE